MTFSTVLANIVGAAAAHPLLQSGAIVGGTFVLEDAATVIAGMLAADGTVSRTTALLSLYVGIALGDVGLYGLGRAAASHRWAKRFVRREPVEALRSWLRQRLVTAVLATRFLPGMRLPTYTTCGFLRLPFGRFTATVIVATLIWTTLLFALSFGFGRVAAEEFGAWKWPLGLLLAFGVLGIGQIVARRHAPERSQP
jgi:membrane protein DedA with SNARE-associated domain